MRLIDAESAMSTPVLPKSTGITRRIILMTHTSEDGRMLLRILKRSYC